MDNAPHAHRCACGRCDDHVPINREGGPGWFVRPFEAGMPEARDSCRVCPAWCRWMRRTERPVPQSSRRIPRCIRRRRHCRCDAPAANLRAVAPCPRPARDPPDAARIPAFRRRNRSDHHSHRPGRNGRVFRQCSSRRRPQLLPAPTLRWPMRPAPPEAEPGCGRGANMLPGYS